MILSHKIFGVAGKPILHSKSPDIFKYISMKYNILDNSYIRIISDSARETVEIMKSLDICGLNITYPFKADILDYIDEISKEAELISSVNVIISEDKRLIGYNTDYLGVINSIKEKNIDVIGKRCLVIGCGGAGRAAVYGMIQSGMKVKIINRTNDIAKDFANRIKCEFAEWNCLVDEINNSDLIINTVPSGELNIDEYLTEGKYIFQADYSKLSNKLQGDVISGIHWLVNQAIPSFEHFTGVNLREDNEVSDSLRGVLEPSNPGVQKKGNIALIGFIGSGKTTIGKMLAKKINWDFFDTDEMIVNEENIPIKEIFRTRGESYFRNLEKEVLLSLKDKKNIIISCGGGLILEEENSALLKEMSNIFWVYSPVEICIDRLKSELRPPLTNPLDSTIDPIEKAEILFKYRIPYYCDIADALLYNNSLLTDAVDKIYDEVHTYFGY
jgi:shikimate dehydrogenase